MRPTWHRSLSPGPSGGTAGGYPIGTRVGRPGRLPAPQPPTCPAARRRWLPSTPYPGRRGTRRRREGGDRRGFRPPPPGRWPPPWRWRRFRTFGPAGSPRRWPVRAARPLRSTGGPTTAAAGCSGARGPPWLASLRTAGSTTGPVPEPGQAKLAGSASSSPGFRSATGERSEWDSEIWVNRGWPYKSFTRVRTSSLAVHAVGGYRHGPT